MGVLQTLSAPDVVCDMHCNRLSPQLSLTLLDQIGRFRPVSARSTFSRRAKDEAKPPNTLVRRFLRPSPFKPSPFEASLSSSARFTSGLRNEP